MNLLTNKLPDTVSVGGKKYLIRTDFRVWIRFGELCLDVVNNLAEILTLCYLPNELPTPLPDALAALSEFYLCGKKLSRGSDMSGGNPIISFADDAEYIYSAYLSQYGIALTTADLHWYQFMALMKSLDDNCKISKIMEARAVKLSDIKDKSLREYYKKMKRAYRLTDNRTDEQREADMIAAMSSFF